METIKVNIIEPKAFQILQNLADLKLIEIKIEKSSREFDKLLASLRSKPSISLDEITQEVEDERGSRYEK
jgi:hypothetical protein